MNNQTQPLKKSAIIRFRREIRECDIEFDHDKAKDPIHMHDYFHFWYAISGTYTHYLDGASFQMGPGSMFIVPPYVPHYVDTRNSSDDIKLVCCEFTKEFIDISCSDDKENTLLNMMYLEPILIGAQLVKPHLYFTGEEAEKMTTLLTELVAENAKKDEFYEMFIRANIIKLLATIARKYNDSSTQKRRELYSRYRDGIEEVLNYIDVHYMEKIYLKDMCRISLMATSVFSLVFKSVTGKTFTEYLQYLRILKAKSMLENTDRTLFNISRECGFIDAAYFHRIFKKFIGKPPGSCRRNSMRG